MKKTKYHAIKEVTSVDLSLVVTSLENKIRKKSKSQIIKESKTWK